MSTVVEVEGVVKQFGSLTALKNVSFSIKSSEVVGFVGANGAGKTTTISTLLGFISPSSGTIKLFDEEVSASSSHRLHQRIGYASGDMELPSRLTGRQYLNFILHQSHADHSKRLVELCDQFQPQLDKKIGTLSRGNKQKIALIGAFVSEPELILLDEPTSGLDPVMQEVFLGLIRQAQAAGTTVFMSSHYLTEVADVCTRVILMREGEIIEDVSSKQLLERSGKTVRIVTGYKATKPPQHATDVEYSTEDGLTTLSFVYGGETAGLQRWLAAVKQLHDIEVSEYNLEGAFKSMYKSEDNVS